MIHRDNVELTVATGFFSFVGIPYLYFFVILMEIPYLLCLPIAFTTLWITFVVKSNKDYKLMKLQELVIEIDEYQVTDE